MKKVRKQSPANLGTNYFFERKIYCHMGGNILHHNAHMRHMLRSQTARFQTHGHRQIQRNASLRVSESYLIPSCSILFHFLERHSLIQVLFWSAVLRWWCWSLPFDFRRLSTFLSFLVTPTCSSNLEPVAKIQLELSAQIGPNVFGQCSSLESSFCFMFIPTYASIVHE